MQYKIYTMDSDKTIWKSLCIVNSDKPSSIWIDGSFRKRKKKKPFGSTSDDILLQILWA